MINSLSIRNFKSIANAELEFGRVNLFIGANGSGKSNLLEAIGLYSSCLGRGIDPDILSSKGVRLSAARIFKSSFKKQPTPGLIRLAGSMNGATYSAALRTKANSSQLEFFSESLTEGNSRILSRRLGSSRMMRSDAPKQPATPVDANPHRGLWDTHGSLAEVTPRTRAELNGIAKYVIYAPQTAFMRSLARIIHDGS